MFIVNYIYCFCTGTHEIPNNRG